MSFVSTNSQIKNNILNYIRHLVSKTLYRAIEILFKPCCDVYVTKVEVVCLPLEPYGTYEVTLTLSRPLGFLGNGNLIPIVQGQLISYGGIIPYTEGTVITFTTRELTTLVGTTGNDITVFGLLPVSGVSNSINEANPFVGDILIGYNVVIDFPNCWA